MVEKQEVERQALGAKLKEAREYVDLPQEDVARVLGVPRSAISMMEAGQRRVDTIELKKLAALYQRSVDYFTGMQRAVDETPETIRHLARAAKKLTEDDREELLRFAKFLQARAPQRKP